MPAYRVETQSSSDRDLERLSPMLFERVERKIRALAQDPRPPGCQKLSGIDMYRVRVGDHRIVYRVNDRSRTIIVLRVRHRREVYRKLR